MGRMKRAATGAAILAMMCGSAIAQPADRSNFDKAMAEHAAGWAELRTEGNLNAETATELNNEILAKLDVSQLTLDQVLDMMSKSALYGVMDNKALMKRVGELLQTDEAAEAAQGEQMRPFMTLIGSYVEGGGTEAYKNAAKFLLNLPDDMGPQGAGAMRQVVSGLAKAVSDDTRAMHAKVLDKAIHMTKLAMEGMPEAQAERMKDTIAFYKGPFARGELMNNPMPQMDIIWASSPEVTSMEAFRGKVLVLDFWATWCGPCISSFPQIKKVNDYYKDYDVAIVGVTSLQGFSVNGPTGERIDCADNPEKEYEEMVKFMDHHENMNWQVVFTEQSCFNPDFGVMGIPHMAMVDPSGKVRHNALHPAGVSFEEKVEMINAMLLEAGLEAPPPPATDKADAAGG